MSSSKGVACAEGAAFSMVLTWPPGRILVAWDRGGVYAVRFLAPGEGAEMSGASEPPGGGLGPRIRDALARFQESGDWSGVAELPRKQSAASEFTSGVWARISRIPAELWRDRPSVGAAWCEQGGRQGVWGKPHTDPGSLSSCGRCGRRVGWFQRGAALEAVALGAGGLSVC